METPLEDIRGKFDLVLEGYEILRHQMQRNHEDLTEKIDQNTMMIKVLNEKFDGVAADLADHRQDTELHGHYRVCEKP